MRLYQLLPEIVEQGRELLYIASFCMISAETVIVAR